MKKDSVKKVKPKRAPTIYALFVKEKMKNRGNTPVTEMMKKIGADWRSLSEEGKKKFKEKVKKK